MEIKNLSRTLFIITLCIIGVFPQTLSAQFGIGLTLTNDLYQKYTNPSDDLDLGNSSGSAFLNYSIGPKIWIGKPSFSFSAESQVGLGLLGLDTKNFKGLGMANIPIIGQFNFKGASSLGSDQKIGYSLGGGIQYNRTELFGLREKYKDLGLKRSFFPTYIVQAGGGFGFNGFVLLMYIRYGFHPDSRANSLNVGIQFDLNLRAFRKSFNNPNSAL
jgi:hypothetical protein